MNQKIPLLRTTSLLIAALVLSACSTTPPNPSQAIVEQQLGEQYPLARLSAPAPPISQTSLDLASAIQFLLAQSPQVRVELAQLGIADAQRLQAELISNPHLSIGALKPEDGGRWQLDVGLSQPLLELFTRSLRRQVADDNVHNVQLRLQSRLQTLIAQTGDAYYSAIAARQHLLIHQQMLDATLARQQLANSLYRAGNMSENSFLYYDNELRRVQQQVNKRKHNADEQYLTLLNRLGMNSHQTISLPDQLPVLPTEKLTHAKLFKQAHTDRLDIKIITQQAAQLDNRRSLIHSENGWRDMSVGFNAEREFDGATNVGPELELALPLFNRNQGKLAAIDAHITKTQAQLAQTLLDADTEIAQALNQMQLARDQLELINASLQVAEKRVTLANREVNFMLGSPFELLSIKRQQIQLAHDYTHELKNFWQARTRLELAIGRALPVASPAVDHSKMDHSKMDHDAMKQKHQNNQHQNHQHHNHHKQDKPTESVDKTTSEQEEHNHD